jgi:hypothetical protein
MPPSSGPQFSPIGPTDAQVVDQMKQAWDDWYNNPNATTGQNLLNFIEANRAQIEKIAGNNHSIVVINSTPPIDSCLDTAVNYLKGWIHLDEQNPSHPPPIIGVSEFVADVYNWISYARG